MAATPKNLNRRQLFSKETNGKFYNESNRIVGTSPWYKASVGLFVFSVFCVIVSLGKLISDPSDPYSEGSFLYLDVEWHIVSQIPAYVAYVGWLDRKSVV